jgi:hypothetical protein
MVLFGLLDIRDMVLCGLHIIRDMVLCGRHIIRDAVLCGLHIRDMVLCGLHDVVDAVLCGLLVDLIVVEAVLHVFIVVFLQQQLFFVLWQLSGLLPLLFRTPHSLSFAATLLLLPYRLSCCHVT